MAKLKAGDQVRNIQDDHNYIPFGQTGVVKESDDHAPFVDWGDPYGKWPQNENHLELITEESRPDTDVELANAPGTIEHWRWAFAGQAMQGILANGEFLKSHKDVYVEQVAIKYADALIAELKKGGKP